MIKKTIKEYAINCTIALVVLIVVIAFIKLDKSSITGFATKEKENANESAAENETQAVTNESLVKETEKEEKEEKEKPEKEEKPKEKGPNIPPVWKSDINEFRIEGKTIIDLNDYFFDENNDTLTYTAITPEKISVTIDNSLATLTPLENNFTTTITFTASDGDKSTSKEVTLIVPERAIIINLQYNLGTIYDIDDNGVEATYGVIDFGVENSRFTWDVDETKLCARWEVYSLEDGSSTTFCNGDIKCCSFIGLSPTKEKWDELLYLNYGQFGATLNNIVSAQIIYVDYGKIDDKPFVEIYYSEWQNLSADYYFASIDFENVCVDTCILTGFDEGSYKLIFEIDNGFINLDKLTYSIFEEIKNVTFNLEVIDSQGANSGTYFLYKDNVPVVSEDGVVKPDYYDIEVIPADSIKYNFDKLSIKNVDITKPLAAIIGIDNVTREVLIGYADVKKMYAVTLEGLEFEKATLTSNASANSLFKCRQWDFERELCFGAWEKIKDLVAAQPYELTLGKENAGFIEADSNITFNISQLNLTNVTSLIFAYEIPNITMIANNNATLNLSQYFLNIENDTIFNYFKPDNISIELEDNIAHIIPDKDFLGTRYTYITANKSNSIAVSNIFSINLIEAVPFKILLNITDVVVNITDPAMQLKLKSYADIELKPILNYNTITFNSYQITNDVVIVSLNFDGKEMRWMTSLRNFNEVLNK